MLKLRRPLATLLLAAAVLSAGCFKSKNVVKKVKPGDDLRLDGVTYALPRTVVQVRIPFKRSETKSGLFERYAPCFFPKEIAAGRVRGSEVKFRMDQPTFSSAGEPDPDEHYVAKIKGGYFENKTMDLAFNADGVITKGEASSENKAVDFAIKAARTAISVASKGLTPLREERGTEGLDEELEGPAREAAVDICRSQVVAEAASEAAEVAKGVAEALKDAAAMDFAKKAQAEAALAEREIAAHQQKLQNQLGAQTVLVDQARKKAAPNTDGENDPGGRGEGRTPTDARPSPERGRRRNSRRTEVGAAQARATSPQDRAAADLAAYQEVVKGAQGAVKGVGSALLGAVIKNATNAKQYIEEVAKLAGRAAEEAKAAAKAAEDAERAAKTPQEAEKAAGVKKEKKAAAEKATAGAEAATKAAKQIGDTIDIVGNNQSDSPAGLAFANGFDSADEINERLEQLRRQRENLTGGDSTPSNITADALKLLIDHADAAILKYERTYFLGMEDVDSWSGDFRFVPIKADPFGTNVFQTSQMLLVQVKDGLCPTPESIRLGVKIKGTFASKGCPDPGGIPQDGAGIWLRVSRERDSDEFLKSMATANAREEVRGERGFYYRIPATAVVTLIKGKSQVAAGEEPPAKDIVARDRMRVAQLGVTASLPASAAGRKTQYTIDFDESTGAMKNFKLASNALLESTLADEAGGAATDIITAKQAREAARDERSKAKAAAADPLAQKKRELELLQTENAINEEKKKLSESQPAPTPEPTPEP